MHSTIFDGLSEDEKEDFLNSFKQKKLPKGKNIKKEGDALKKAFFVIEGEVDVKKSSSEGDMQVCTVKGGEDILFSVTCMIDGGSSLTTVTTKEDTLILEITMENFLDFCQKNCQAGIKIYNNITKLLAGFIRKNDEKIAEMYKTLEEVL